MHPDTGAQFVEIDRLGEIIHPTHIKGMHDMLGLGQPGHEDHRHLRDAGHRLEPRAGLKAIEARHHRIHEDDIGHDLAGNAERGFTAAGQQDRNALRFQRRGEKSSTTRWNRRPPGQCIASQPRSCSPTLLRIAA
jgi:hypothetical protein